MFDKLKAMGALAGLMKNQDGLRQAADRVKEKMERTRCTGQAGQGAVRAVVDGKLRVVEVELAPALAAGIATDDRTRQLAGTLIAQAVNDGITQAITRLREAVAQESQALGLPDIPGLDNLLR